MWTYSQEYQAKGFVSGCHIQSIKALKAQGLRHTHEEDEGEELKVITISSNKFSRCERQVEESIMHSTSERRDKGDDLTTQRDS